MQVLQRPARRKTRVVRVGRLAVGGDNPVLVQSMTVSDTLDTEAVVAEIARLVDAGCPLVRLTAPTVNDARNLAVIKERLLKRGIDVPLVADIHFSPAAALEAARHVEKVRINPGNFVDSKRFLARDYTDAEYAEELARIEERFAPLVETLKRLGRALRIGTNHGSLSDRIMNRYGDTPLGMVESALEYVRLCRKNGYHDLILSMKASSPKVMIAAYRLLAQRMDAEGMDYPLHLGVTEAGDGKDGRLKSAVGIGTLLAEGLGDTIRVSLTEPSENEIPVARDLIALTSNRTGEPLPVHRGGEGAGLKKVIRVVSDDAAVNFERRPEIPTAEMRARIAAGRAACVADGKDVVALIGAYRRLAQDRPGLPLHLDVSGLDDLAAAVVSGSLLCDGIGDTLEAARLDLAYDLLQAAGVRVTKAEFVSCPSCGRTLFDLQSTTERIKERTAHLTGVKIAVMGCIVNGPGEMADADFGYVGAGPGTINLYVGKDCVKKGLPTEQAVDALVDLIKAHGKWADPK